MKRAVLFGALLCASLPAYAEGDWWQINNWTIQNREIVAYPSPRCHQAAQSPAAFYEFEKNIALSFGIELPTIKDHGNDQVAVTYTDSNEKQYEETYYRGQDSCMRAFQHLLDAEKAEHERLDKYR